MVIIASLRREQIYLEPGIGVLKFIHEEAPAGSLEIKLQEISTLIAFHIQ